MKNESNSHITLTSSDIQEIAESLLEEQNQDCQIGRSVLERYRRGERTI